MSPGAIAVTAIIVSGAEVGSLVVAGAVLIYTKRIMLAATPKPQAPQQPKRETASEPVKTGPVPLERAS